LLPARVVAGNGLRPLKHDEFPPIARLVRAKDIEVSVVSPDFEVAMIRSGPPIDVLDDLDASPFQMNALRVPGTAVVAFDIYPHVAFPGANQRRGTAYCSGRGTSTVHLNKPDSPIDVTKQP
jgi:hypothetical protein